MWTCLTKCKLLTIKNNIGWLTLYLDKVSINILVEYFIVFMYYTYSFMNHILYSFIGNDGDPPGSWRAELAFHLSTKQFLLWIFWFYFFTYRKRLLVCQLCLWLLGILVRTTLLWIPVCEVNTIKHQLEAADEYGGWHKGFITGFAQEIHYN